jgi:hypothetical protein
MPPKRHHYIPKFFLERFCRDGMLWVYDRESNEFRHQSPVNTAVIGDYYAAVGEEGGKNLDAENLLSRIETAARPVLEKVDAGQELTSEDRQWLAVFIGFLGARVPDFEKMFAELVDHGVKMVTEEAFATLERTRELMARYERARPDAKPIDPEKLREFILRGRFTTGRRSSSRSARSRGGGRRGASPPGVRDSAR